MLRGFLVLHPEFLGRDFYISGESYAGKFVPSVAHHLKFDVSDVDLNLKGIAIGNGQVNPYDQYTVDALFAFENGLTSATTWENMQTVLNECVEMIDNIREDDVDLKE